MYMLQPDNRDCMHVLLLHRHLSVILYSYHPLVPVQDFVQNIKLFRLWGL